MEKEPLVISDLTIYTDGGARGNPGPAAIGVAIYDEKNGLRTSFGEYIGVATNNQAEYRALLAGLRSAKKYKAVVVHCFLDSELVVRQMKREYKVKDVVLQGLFLEAWNLAQTFSRVTYQHVPRRLNTVADRMVNEALDAVDR